MNNDTGRDDLAEHTLRVKVERYRDALHDLAMLLAKTQGEVTKRDNIIVVLRHAEEADRETIGRLEEANRNLADARHREVATLKEGIAARDVELEELRDQLDSRPDDDDV